MGIEDLKKLGEREYRVFLILIIWLLIGFTLFQFQTIEYLGIIVFFPLIGVCAVLSFVAIALRKDLKKLSFKKVFLYCLIAVPLMILMIVFLYVTVALFLIAIFSYIFITSLFSIYNCYRFGIKLDEKIYQTPRIISFFLRWGEFIGGTYIAIVIMIWIGSLGIIFSFTINTIGYTFYIISSLIIVLIAVLCVIAFIFALFGRLNAWLGIFYVWVSFYSFYLLFSAFYGLGETAGMNITFYKLILYFFDLFLIIFTISSLVGKRSELISVKLHMKSDSVLIWLIFSKATYEFAKNIPQMGIETIRALLGFFLFVPIMFIAGLYGIVQYGKVKRIRKAQKEQKELIERAKKEGRLCLNCGCINEQGFKFCKDCGASLQKF